MYEALMNEVQKNAAEIWEDILWLYPTAGKLPSIAFELTKSKRAGYIQRRNGAITFNMAFILSIGIEDYKQTIAHELAHAVQFRCFPEAKQAHGKEFRSILQSIGMDTTTYHSYSVRKAREQVTPKKAANISAALLD